MTPYLTKNHASVRLPLLQYKDIVLYLITFLLCYKIFHNNCISWRTFFSLYHKTCIWSELRNVDDQCAYSPQKVKKIYTPSWYMYCNRKSTLIAFLRIFDHRQNRHARACSSYECFILRAARLSSKLFAQGYVIERLKSSLRKFYGRYGDLIKHYEVSLSKMLHDILGHDHVQWHPQLIRHYSNVRTYYRTGLYYRFWPYYQILEVSIEHCYGCG